MDGKLSRELLISNKNLAIKLPFVIKKQKKKTAVDFFVLEHLNHILISQIILRIKLKVKSKMANVWSKKSNHDLNLNYELQRNTESVPVIVPNYC